MDYTTNKVVFNVSSFNPGDIFVIRYPDTPLKNYAGILVRITEDTLTFCRKNPSVEYVSDLDLDSDTIMFDNVSIDEVVDGGVTIEKLATGLEDKNE